MWKSKKTPEVVKLTQQVPVGSFVKIDDDYFYVSGSLELMRIVSERVLATWSAPFILKSTKETFKLGSFKVVGKLKPRNGVFVRNFFDSKIYFVEKGKKRPVMNPVWVRAYEAEAHLIFNLAADEIALLPTGEPLV